LSNSIKDNLFPIHHSGDIEVVKL